MNANILIPPQLPSYQDAAPELARRLGMILAGLAALIARRFLRLPHLVALIVPLWGHLGRAARRFERLVTRPGRPGQARPARCRAAAGARGKGLPRRRGWLVRELGWEAAGFGCQLEALLTEPAMQALVAGLPGAGRILRPLCRMLGVREMVVPAQVPVVVVPTAVPASPGRPAADAAIPPGRGEGCAVAARSG